MKIKWCADAYHIKSIEIERQTQMVKELSSRQYYSSSATFAQHRRPLILPESDLSVNQKVAETLAVISMAAQWPRRLSGHSR